MEVVTKNKQVLCNDADKFISEVRIFNLKWETHVTSSLLKFDLILLTLDTSTWILIIWIIHN